MPNASDFPQYTKLSYQRDGAARASFVADIEEMLAAGKRKLSQFSEEAKATLDSALSVKRNDAGSLDLGVPQLREAAAAQQARAMAAREVAEALAITAREEGKYTQEVRQSIAAAKALAREEEVAAQAALARANAAEQVQERLNRQASATEMVMSATKRGTEANHMMVNSVRAQRVAFVQAGQQMQDMAIQFQMGTKASTIMAQQLPQLGFAFSGLAGNSNKALDRLGQFGTFIAGPWGAMLTIGLVALGPLIDKIFESGEEAEKAKKRHRTLSEVLMDEKASIEEVTAALEEYRRAQQQATEVDILAIKTRAEAIASKLKDAIATREQIKAELERVEGTTRRGAQSESQDVVRNAAFARADSLRQQTLDNQSLIDKLNVAAFGVRNETARYVADLQTDPEKKLKEGFAIQRRQVQGLAEDYSVVQKRLEDINRQEKAALDSLRKANSERRSDAKAKGDSSAIAAFSSPLASYSVTSAYLKQREGYKHQGIDMAAPEGTPVYAAQAGAVDFAGSGGTYGNLIKLGHGGGTETRYAHLSKFAVKQGDTVEQGQLIGNVGSTGRSTGSHLHYEVRVNGKAVDPTKGQFPIDPAKVTEAAQKAADALQKLGDKSADDIARINAQFDETPRLVDQATAATRHLDETISELRDKKPAGWEKLIDDAENAKITIQDALVRPYQELTRESERRIEIESLLAAGREDEAEAMRTIWQYEERNADLREDQKAAILDQVKYERQITEELRARQDIIGAYLDASRSVKQELVSIFSGSGSIGNLQNTFKQLNAQVMVDKIFGPMFRDLDNWVKEQSGVTQSVDHMATETRRAGDEAKSFADDLNTARRMLSGGGAAAKSPSAFDAAFAPLFGASAANDNSLGGILQRIQEQSTNEILVVGNKIAKHVETTANNLTPDLFARKMGTEMAKTLGDTLPAIFGGQATQGILGGAIYGNMVGGAPGAILGGLGGIPGLPTGLADLFSSGLQGLSGASLITDIASSFGIKIPGEAKYGLLTGLLKKIFGGAKYGNASFQNGVMSVNGNNGDLKTGAQTSGDNLLSTLNQIADSLGATLGAFSVSLGQTDGKWRISSTGRTGELKSKYSDVQVFGTGDAAYQQALEAAIRDAISDGAIQGISQAAQNILKAGGDLQKAIEKAALVQSIPRQLKQLTDPVGYAVDELNREFTKVVDALKLGSASAAEYADAEKLYNLKRAEAIKQASEQVMGSLKSLYDDLTVGNDAFSLRDRLTGAYSKFDPLKDRVAAGDSTAYADFADAARVVMDLERQLNGSQGGYFSFVDSLKELTKSEMDRQQAMIDAASSSANPFSSNAIAANDNQGMIDALGQTNNLLSAILQNQILGIQTGTGGGYSFDLSGYSVGNYY